MITPVRWTGHEAGLLRTALRMSVRVFAAHLGVAERTISKWEKAGSRTTPWPNTQAILDTALVQAGDDAKARFARLLSDSTAIASTDGASSSLLVASHSLVPADNGGHLADGALSVLNADEQEHIAAALADARRYLDGSVVDYFGRQLDACEADDGLRGPTKVLPTVLGILGAIDHHARGVTPSVRCALLSVGARGAEFAGWLYRDVQQLQQAAFWYGRATEWAQEASDMPMQGYILLRKSQMAYDERDAVRVLTLAQAAQYGPWQLPHHVRAEVTQQEARGLAMVGERIDTVQRKLDDARRLLSKNNQANISYEDVLALRDASCYVEAGKPREAAALYSRVLSTDALSHRDRGYFLARSASSLALAGEPDEAADKGLEAAQVASAMTSQRTQRELMRTLAALEPWCNRPGPRALHEAVIVSPSLVMNRPLPNQPPSE